MEVGAFLYQLTARDTQSPLMEPITARKELAAVATGVQALIFTVPSDRALHIDSCGFEGVPGAADIAQSGAIIAQQNGSQFSVSVLAETFASGGAGIIRRFAREMNIILPPLTQIYVAVYFDAAAAANQANGFFSGWLIPKGNLGSV